MFIKKPDWSDPKWDVKHVNNLQWEVICTKKKKIQTLKALSFAWQQSKTHLSKQDLVSRTPGERLASRAKQDDATLQQK